VPEELRRGGVGGVVDKYEWYDLEARKDVYGVDMEWAWKSSRVI